MTSGAQGLRRIDADKPRHEIWQAGFDNGVNYEHPASYLFATCTSSIMPSKAVTASTNTTGLYRLNKVIKTTELFVRVSPWQCNGTVAM